jgi:hypothetical protein
MNPLNVLSESALTTHRKTCSSTWMLMCSSPRTGYVTNRTAAENTASQGCGLQNPATSRAPESHPAKLSDPCHLISRPTLRTSELLQICTSVLKLTVNITQLCPSQGLKTMICANTLRWYQNNSAAQWLHSIQIQDTSKVTVKSGHVSGSIAAL